MVRPPKSRLRPKSRPQWAFVRLCGLVFALSGLTGCARDESPDEAPRFVHAFGTFGSQPGQFRDPNGIALDAAGNVYVLDSGNHRVQKFSNHGELLATWGSEGTGEGQFVNGARIAVDRNGVVYVTETHLPDGTGSTRIQKFSSSGAFLSSWGSRGSGPGQFEDPVGIATDGASNVYVVEVTNRRVQKLDADGGFLAWVGDSGTGSRPFSFPIEVAVDGGGNVFVVDVGPLYEYVRIVKFDQQGRFVREFGAEVGEPKGIAVDELGQVHVCDGPVSRIHTFTNDGEHVMQWGSFGYEPGELNFPFGIAVFRSRQIFVLEPFNYRVSKFEYRKPPWATAP
jgi:sugar lactone lactonase YvrE